MPRPRRAPDLKPTRERLLEAAETLLEAQGYVGLSLADVARTAGIRKPGLYHHFPSGKDELVLAVAEGLLARNERALERAVASVSEPEAQLRAVARWLLGDSRALDRTLREALRLMPEPARHRITERFFAASFGPVRAAFERRVSDGTFRSLDASFVTHAFFGCLAQLADATLEKLMDLLRNGLRPESPRGLALSLPTGR